MIHVLALNPAVDRTLVVPGFTPGRVHRAAPAHIRLGGKPLDVARVLRRLEQPVRVVGWLGGQPEAFFRAECDALGIEQVWIPIEGETRTDIVIADPEQRLQTVVNETGPGIESQAIDALFEVVLHTPPSTWILSGSLPPGVPTATYAQLIIALQRNGSRALLDTSGVALAEGIDARPWAIKPNEHELHDIPAVAHLAPETAVRELARRATYVCLTHGAEDVLFWNGRALFRATPPTIAFVNGAGSGDAFIAGLVTGLERGDDPLGALRLAVGCGASNAGLPYADIGPYAEVLDLAAAVAIRPVG